MNIIIIIIMITGASGGVNVKLNRLEMNWSIVANGFISNCKFVACVHFMFVRMLVVDNLH